MGSSEPAQVFPYYRSPQSIRNEVFSQRLRGLDADEVDEYLNLLADQVETTERERSELLAEVARLEAEVARLGGRADLAAPVGADPREASVVLQQAVAIGMLGFVPGLAVSLVGYRLTSAAANIPVVINGGRIAGVLALAIVMSAISGALALRKLHRADPAELY